MLRGSRWLMVLSLPILLACGSSDLENGPRDHLDLLKVGSGKPLIPEQKQQLNDLFYSLENIYEAGRNGRANDSVEEMRELIRKGKCIVDIENPGRPPDSNFDLTYSYHISGTNCPIQQRATGRAINRPNINQTYTTDINYVVGDSNYKKLNDIYEIQFKDANKFVFVFRGGGIAIDGSGSGEGFLRSQDFGDIKVRSLMAVQAIASGGNTTGASEYALIFSFEGFEAIYKMRYSYEGKELRTQAQLNGKIIPDEEFGRVLKAVHLTDMLRETNILSKRSN